MEEQYPCKVLIKNWEKNNPWHCFVVSKFFRLKLLVILYLILALIRLGSCQHAVSPLLPMLVRLVPSPFLHPQQRMNYLTYSWFIEFTSTSYLYKLKIKINLCFERCYFFPLIFKYST